MPKQPSQECNQQEFTRSLNKIYQTLDDILCNIKGEDPNKTLMWTIQRYFGLKNAYGLLDNIHSPNDKLDEILKKPENLFNLGGETFENLFQRGEMLLNPENPFREVGLKYTNIQTPANIETLYSNPLSKDLLETLKNFLSANQVTEGDKGKKIRMDSKLIKYLELLKRYFDELKNKQPPLPKFFTRHQKKGMTSSDTSCVPPLKH